MLSCYYKTYAFTMLIWAFCSPNSSNDNNNITKQNKTKK